MRLSLLRRAINLFPRNAIVTPAFLQIHGHLNASTLISIDGSEAIHDSIRGNGSFAKVMRNVKRIPPKSFAIFSVLTADAIEQIKAFPELVNRANALGILVGFQVSGQKFSSPLSSDLRERAVDLLLQLKATIPGVLLNSERSIELFRPCHQKTVAMNCIYKSSAISFDVRLKVKKPCTFEGNADCSSCGCPMVMIHEAKMGGDRESVNLLHALFPKRNSYNIETFVQHGNSQQ